MNNRLDPEDVRRQISGKKPIKIKWTWTTIIFLLLILTFSNILKKELKKNENKRIVASKSSFFTHKEKVDLIKEMAFVLNARYEGLPVEEYFVHDFSILFAKNNPKWFSSSENSTKILLYKVILNKLISGSTLVKNEKDLLFELENLDRSKFNDIELKKIDFYFEWIKYKVFKSFKVSSLFFDKLKFFEKLIKEEFTRKSPALIELEKTKAFHSKLFMVIGVISNSLNNKERKFFLKNILEFGKGSTNKQIFNVKKNNLIISIKRIKKLRTEYIHELKICDAAIMFLNNLKHSGVE